MSDDTKPQASPSGLATLPIFIMVFLSGFAGLVYQVLWMRQLGLLFGNTSHAAATTLAAFFAGLALGSWFWGNRVSAMKQPLRTYALLEVGIAITAILYFGIIDIFHSIYPHLYQNVGAGALLYLCKFVLALALIFPPAFCMGGTIPVIGHFMIRNKTQFGTAAARLYGINTLGAALGAFLTGFYFVFLFGFNRTCAGAIAISLIIAGLALLLSFTRVWAFSPQSPDDGEEEVEESIKETSKKHASKGSNKRKATNKNKTSAKPAMVQADRQLISSIAFLSGFGVLALEVLWTRMFAQIHENSVYSYSSVLVIVLICLALGALLAGWLAKRKKSPVQVLAALTVMSGIAVAFSPKLTMLATNDLQMMTATVAFSKYLMLVYAKGFAIIGLPCLLLGTVFPFLMKSEEHYADDPGKSLGRLAAINTVGAIIGSLLCGFAFLSILGMWRTVQFIGALYLILGILLSIKAQRANVFLKSAAGLTLFLSFTIFSPTDLPIIGRMKNRDTGNVVKVWETSGCTVSVTEDRLAGPMGAPEINYTIQVNSNYTLGSTGAIPSQVNQSKVPLMAFPDTRSVFYLGMGTGITAGAALSPYFNLDRIVVCELVPEVVLASKEFIAQEGRDYTNGLFENDKVEVVVDDGRHYLMATDERFDMINADLFLPYRQGAASLYSVEHFESAKARLNPGGVFVQWLPMYQLTKNEFGIIAKTMTKVFDQVTVWRNNFQPGGEILAFVGHRDKTPLPKVDKNATVAKRLSVDGATRDNLQQLELPMDDLTVMLLYCGNLTVANDKSDIFKNYPINTDDKPLIEYMSPRSLREEEEGKQTVKLVALELVNILEEIQNACPPESDPMLVNRTKENRRLARAGLALHRAWTTYPWPGGYPFGNEVACKAAWDLFVKEWTNR